MTLRSVVDEATAVTRCRAVGSTGTAGRFCRARRRARQAPIAITVNINPATAECTVAPISPITSRIAPFRPGDHDLASRNLAA